METALRSRWEPIDPIAIRATESLTRSVGRDSIDRSSVSMAKGWPSSAEGVKRQPMA